MHTYSIKAMKVMTPLIRNLNIMLPLLVFYPEYHGFKN